MCSEDDIISFLFYFFLTFVLLQVKYINRTVNEAVPDAQSVRNFDLEELSHVTFGDDWAAQMYGDWGIFPMLNWQEDGGDLSSRCILGFDFSI